MNNNLKETLKQIGYDGKEVAIQSENGSGYMLYSSKLNSYVYVPANLKESTSIISVYSDSGDTSSNTNYNTFIQNLAKGQGTGSVVSFAGKMSKDDYKDSAIRLIEALENNGIKINNIGFADSDDNSKTAEEVARLVAKVKQKLNIRSINLKDKNITDYESFLKALKWLIGEDVDEDVLKQVAESLQLEGYLDTSGGGGGGGYYDGGYSSGSYYDDSGNQYNPASNGTVDVTYSAVISGTNAIVSAINSTTFPTETMSFKSTSKFLPSINEANKHFFGATEKLLNNISNDTKNIETILKNYSAIDSQLANSANTVNGTALGSLLSGNYSNNIAIDKAAIMSSYKSLASAFDNKYSSGKVGSIQMSDISSIYSGGKLTGAIGAGLDNEINSATSLKSQINNLITSNAISAPSWELVKNRLGDYSELCDLRIKSAQLLEEAYQDALKMIKEYVDPDEYLDDGEIPEYEEKIAKDEKEVSELEAENASLAQVQCETITCDDGKGNQTSCGEDCSKRDAAQAKIKENNARIETLNAEITKFKAFVEKLKGLADIMTKANDKIQTAVGEIEKMYGSKIDEISPVNVEELSKNEGTAEASTLAAQMGTAGTPVFYNQKGYIDANGQLHQWKSNWGKSIASSGCGPTSLASCLATMTGDTSITPSSIADTMKYNENIGGSFISRITKERGLDMDYHIGLSRSAMDNHLSNGGTMIVAINQGGHYIAVLGKDQASGQYIVCDPNNSKKTLWSYNEIATGHTMVFHIAPQGKTIAQTTGRTAVQV